MQVLPDAHRFVRHFGYGWEVGMYVLRLPDGGTLIHSPTRLGERAFAEIDAIGAPRFLFAPNHFHHLGIPAFAARYPIARVIAAPRALPRLRRKLRMSLEEAPASVGPITVHPALGAKSGEAFLSLDTGRGRAWIVGDAFFNVVGETYGLRGAFLRWANVVPHLKIGKTFRWLALDDIAAYREWLRALFVKERPSWLLPAHGLPFAIGDHASVAAMIERAFA